MKEDLLSVIEKFPGKNIDVKLLLIDKNLIKIMKWPEDDKKKTYFVHYIFLIKFKQKWSTVNYENYQYGNGKHKV